MRHYEIVFMIHPDQSEQISKMIERYNNLISNMKGKVHRIENWGRKQLAYPINKLHKAYYILMNIEVTKKTIRELKNSFSLNDLIIRNIILQKKKAITNVSPILKTKNEKKQFTKNKF